MSWRTLRGFSPRPPTTPRWYRSGSVFGTRTESDGKLPATFSYEVQHAEPRELVAAVLNVTVTEPDSPGFITVYPCSQDLPLASNLDFVRRQTVPNLVIAPVDSQGRVCFYTNATTYIRADINGVFPVGTPTTRETVPVYHLVDAAGHIRIAREFHTAEITSSRAAAAVELMLSVPAADPDDRKWRRSGIDGFRPGCRPSLWGATVRAPDRGEQTRAARHFAVGPAWRWCCPCGGWRATAPAAAPGLSAADGRRRPGGALRRRTRRGGVTDRPRPPRPPAWLSPRSRRLVPAWSDVLAAR